MKTALGLRIKAYRKANKLTQTEFAKLVGCAQSFISNLEKGKHVATDRYGIPAKVNELLKGFRAKTEPMRTAVCLTCAITFRTNTGFKRCKKCRKAKRILDRTLRNLIRRYGKQKVSDKLIELLTAE